MISIAIASVVAAILAALYVHRRIVELNRENHLLKRRAEELTRLKKDFVSYFSHELKAPLASMQETTHVLLEGIPGPLNDKQRRLLELNLRSGKRLTRMISHLMDLRRMEAGIVDFNMQEMDLNALVRDMVAARRAEGMDENIGLVVNTPEEPVNVRCDAGRIVQLLEELLENAFIVSAENTSIRIEVKSIRQFPDRMPERLRKRMILHTQVGFALLCISDSGPGIDDAEKENVFQVFHQLRRHKKAGPSLGLGLAIVRALVDAHGGVTWVEDNPDGGSVFCVLLPLAWTGAGMATRAS